MKSKTEKIIQSKIQSLEYEYNTAAWPVLLDQLEGGAKLRNTVLNHEEEKGKRKYWLFLLICFVGISLTKLSTNYLTNSKHMNDIASLSMGEGISSISSLSNDEWDNHEVDRHEELNKFEQAIALKGKENAVRHEIVYRLDNAMKGESSSNYLISETKRVVNKDNEIKKVEEKNIEKIVLDTFAKEELEYWEIEKLPMCRFIPFSVEDSTGSVGLSITPHVHQDKQTLYLEALGAGGFLSLKYERQIFNRWFVSGGVGVFAESSYDISIPLGVVYRMPLRKSSVTFLEYSAEWSRFTPIQVAPNEQVGAPYSVFNVGAGIFRKSKNNFVWKAKIGPMINVDQDVIVPWGCISIGKGF